MKVDVYSNLRTGAFSVRHRGRVVATRDEVWIEDARFVVSEAGRRRVLRDRQRNVHAVVRGTLIDAPSVRAADAALGVPVRYNPYVGPHFLDDAGRPVAGADVVYAGAAGMLVHGVRYMSVEERMRPARRVLAEMPASRSLSDPDVPMGLSEEEVAELIATVPVLR